MFHALDLGISVDEFWEMTPRAICVLLDEMARTTQAVQHPAAASRPVSAGTTQVVHLDYIPRP